MKIRKKRTLNATSSPCEKLPRNTVLDTVDYRKIIDALSKFYILSYGQLASKTLLEPDALSAKLKNLVYSGYVHPVEPEKDSLLSSFFKISRKDDTVKHPGQFWELSREGQLLPFLYSRP